MSSMAVLVFLFAIGVPVFLLRRWHSQAWYWHALAILAAMGIGFIPTSPDWKIAEFDLAFGFVILFLLVWGFGGLLRWRPHRERHV